MTDDHKRMMMDNYLLGPDGGPLQAEGKPEADGKEKPNPFTERAREYRNFTLKTILFSGAVLVGGLFLADHVFERQKKESKGGEECYPLWQKVETELRKMQAEDASFRQMDSADATRGALDGYQKAKTRMNERFSEKARAWMNCLDKQRQKNAPVAAPAKRVPRARNNL